MSTKHRLFVYGTLKASDNSVRSSVLERHGGKYIGRAVLKGKYGMYSLGHFPAVVRMPKEGSAVVYGELWNVPQELLDYCDSIEGHPHFYKRERVPIMALARSRPKPAWCYLLAGHERLHEGRRISPAIWNPQEADYAEFNLER